MAIGTRGASYGDLVGNKGGLTPLLFAVREGNMKTAEVLLNAGADVNQVSAGDHSSPLLMATINGQFDLNLPFAKEAGIPNLGGAKIEIIYADTKGDPKNGLAEAELVASRASAARSTGGASGSR